MSDAPESSAGGGTPRKRPRKLRKAGQLSVDEGSNFSMAGENERSYAEMDADKPSFSSKEGALGKDTGDGDSMAEREMRQHFMDVEPSFLPDTPMSSLADEDRAGADDTYLELANGGAEKDDSTEPETPADAYKTPATGHYSADDEEDSPASPAEAAASRHARKVSTASARTLKPARASVVYTQASSPGSSSRASSPPPPQRPMSSVSTVRDTNSPAPHHVALPGSGTNSLSSFNGYQSVSPPRPNFHRSTASSSTIASDISTGEDALNLDYALQSGGSLAGSRGAGTSRARSFLSRLPSLGSINFYMSGDETPPQLSRGVSGASILASRRGGRLENHDQEDRPETPRANQSHFDAPTDTAIAQHVQSIEVPETVARDFRLRNRSLSPDKRPASSSGGFENSTIQDRPRRTLTLKEQNSKIDKLTKENFDLKLKIHFLDQALQNRSDDGVKELIEKNVQFQTDLANERKETQGLRRKVKEMERKMKEQEEALLEARSQRNNREEDDDDPTLQAEMHEEILYLRQQLDHSENQVSTLREEMIYKESEKRKMAEHMRGMAAKRGEDTTGVKETMEMWQDLLNAETGRREQAEEDIQKLRDDLTALRIERASPAANRLIKQNRRRSRLGSTPTLVGDDESDFLGGENGSETNSVLVFQLKHENAELRRDLGAQTSMLTSRNRERERLQQEIEDLKLLQRKSDGARSVAGESIFDRSISRAHQRAPSRASEHTNVTQITEAERDEWDRKEGNMRDHNAELRMKFQELERTHNAHLQYVSVIEGDFQELEQELHECQEDAVKIQAERDDALQAYDEKENELASLKEEALNEINALDEEKKDLEAQLQEANHRHQKIQSKLQNTTDGYKGLQGELREITQSVMNLEDEKQANSRTIQNLEQQIAEAEDEIQKWEQKCNEMDQKSRKLEITQESLHSEITFLREEQEGDKIKIGELEDAINAAQQTIQDEQEKLREMEDAVTEERQQRDVLENHSKEEVQKVLDDLNSEHAKVKDEVRQLRRSLSAKEVESGGWKQRLEDLEQHFRHALGDPSGTKQSLLANIEKLQRKIESTASDLDRAKMDVADKDRLLRHREGLLESSSLESRRLSDLLDKERASRKHELEQFEKASHGQATHMRTIAQQQSRALELETAWTQDKRKLATLEQQYREQLHERNSLLLALWNRLSTICGADWAQRHALVDGELPNSAEVISRHLPAFQQNVIGAVKTIEALLGSFKVRVRSIEKDLWRDYQTLEHNLDIRVRRMDHLERAVIDAQRALAEEAAQHRPSAPSRSGSSRNMGKTIDETNKLKSEVKLLKAELKFHRQHPSAMAQQMLNAQQSPVDGRRQSNSSSGTLTHKASTSSTQSPARALVSHLLRHHSTSAVEQLHAPVEEPPGSASGLRHQSLMLASPPIQPSEQRWVHRLKEMERRLKAEREARLLDRRGARQRLEEGRLEIEEVKRALERERDRRGSSAMSGEMSGMDEEEYERRVSAMEEDARRMSGEEGEEQVDTDRSVD